MQNGASVNSDLEELWRRIVFNICISNTDDHLRNHGFLLTPGGWTLSPAYDMNPVEYGSGLQLNISLHDNTQDTDIAMEVAKEFRIDNRHARKIIQSVQKSVQQWPAVAKSLGLSKSEQARMEGAFRHNGQ